MKSKILTLAEKNASAFLAWARKPAIQRVGYTVAAALFIGGVLWSWQAIDLDFGTVRWGYFILLACLPVPAIILTNILELYYSARLVGAQLSFMSCVKVSILSSAANLLPLPAGPLMRAAAVVGSGGSVRGGAVAVLYPAVLWLAIGFLFTAVGTLLVGQIFAGASFALAGCVLGLFCFALARRDELDSAAGRQIFWIKFVGASFDALAIFLTLQFIGAESGIVQALGLSAAGPLGAAVSVVPAGLGVREVASSALGLVVGLSAAHAFLAPSLYRITYLGVLAVMCPFMMKIKGSALAGEEGARRDD